MTKIKVNPFGEPIDFVGGLTYKYPTGAPSNVGKIQNFFETSINYTSKSYEPGYLVTYPIIIKNDVKIDKVRIGIMTPAVGNLIYGLYKQGNDGLPDSLLFQSSAFNTNVSGTATYTLPSPYKIKAGLYWVAYNSSSAPVGPGTFIAGVLANVWSDMSASQYSYFFKTFAYTGTLPSTFGSGGTISTGNTSINFCEFILL